MLKKQIETASEEWVSKTAEWESEQRQNHTTITNLRQENLGLKTQVGIRDLLVVLGLGLKYIFRVMKRKIQVGLTLSRQIAI